MTGRRNTIIAVGAIVLFAAIVGFFITLDVSPQIAYARLFIDVGLIIGLVAVILALYRPELLKTGNIVHALKDLSKNRYHTRISVDEGDNLKDVASAINDLAQALENQHNKQEKIKQGLREELLPSLKAKEPTTLEHSYHPEIGPVLALPVEEKQNQLEKPATPTASITKESISEIATENDETNKNILNNTLVESKPPKEEKIEATFIPEIEQQDQDLGELYQRFINAQEESMLTKIDYTNFLKSVEKTRAQIMETHKCQGVSFDIVKEPDQVALQPKLIR